MAWLCTWGSYAKWQWKENHLNVLLTLKKTFFFFFFFYPCWTKVHPLILITGIKIITSVKILIFDGYVKVREPLYARVVIWVNTISNYIDIRVIFPKYESSCILNKVDIPTYNVSIVGVPISEWYVVRCGSKNGHQEKHMFQNNFGLCAQNMLTILCSMFYTIGGTYMAT